MYTGAIKETLHKLMTQDNCQERTLRSF
jgi:hypothetical protein